MADIARDLDHLGFEKGSIVETIVTTWNIDKTPNAAPMGVVRTGPDIIEIRPFKTSLTHRNLFKNVESCINITQDPETFFVTAFKHDLPLGFDEIEINDELQLEHSDAHIFVEVKEHKPLAERREAFDCQVKSIKITKPTPRVFSRGRAEAIEAVIHATRIEEFLKRGIHEDAERLILRVAECREIVERVSSAESKEVRVVKALIEMIENWREGASRSL
jgi:hypothetical protein